MGVTLITNKKLTSDCLMHAYKRYKVLRMKILLSQYQLK